MTSKHCAIAVHSSLSLDSPLVFDYKGTLFKWNPSETSTHSDSLVCRMGALSFEQAFKLAYEFFSALCFAVDAKVILGSGIINEVPMDIAIEDMHMNSVEPRQIAVLERHPTVYRLALVRDELQSSLIRLFRHAFSQSDPFTKLLFYWHSLVYPSAEETAAVAFINEHSRSLPNHLRPHLTAVQRDPFFSTASDANDIGVYIRNGIRHSIAHIVRSGAAYSSIEMDNLDAIRHVYSAALILEYLSRRRIETEFSLQIGNDASIFTVRRTAQSAAN